MTDKLRALVRRDLLTAAQGPLSLVFQLATVLLEVAGLFFLARAVGPGFRPEGMAFFPFLLVGSTFYATLIGGVQAFVEAVRSAQMAGTLEVLLSTPTHDTIVILLLAASSFLGRACQLVLAFIAACLLFGLKLSTSHLLAFALTLIASIAVVVAIGILAAAIQVSTGKGSSLVWLFASCGALISGALFPISALPRAVQGLAWLFPMTHCLEAMRIALLPGTSMKNFASHLGLLSVWAVGLVPFSLLALKHTLGRARHDGTLATYY